ncbi:MAG: 5'-methylthioadenosine/S-adenosylhomocysteine nucleosidase [Lachnospiraceae bacterium]|nr:5'-methylthioadenosine/S-adenosylhomocysteine nucleosidase [Lachnospiraceae bacterium]
MEIYRENLKEKRPVLLQGAMESEVCRLIAHLDDAREEVLCGYSFYTGSYRGYPVIVQKTLQGMTNAAAATMLAIEHHLPSLIINQGICGGHSPALHRGDILLGQEIMNYSNFKVGITEHSNPLLGCEAIGCETFSGKVALFYSDSALVRIAQSCNHPVDGSNILTGKISSADAWLDRKDLISLMHETFGSCGEDMETASVAQICHMHDIPLLSVRMLSNTRVHDEEYDESVADCVQQFTLRVLDKILEDVIAG